MADLDSLYNALRNADAAGDTEGAKRLAQYIQQVQTAAPVEAPKQSTIGSELKRGAQQVASSLQTAYGALTGSPEEAARRGVERGEAINQVAGEGVGFDPVKKAYQEKGVLPAAGEAVSQIPRALAGQGANLAVMAGGARLGSKIGSVAGPLGRIAGGALGAGAAMVPQFFGSNVERQAAEQMESGEPININRARAGTAAAGQAALEGAGYAFTLGKGVVKGVLGIVDDAAITSARTAKQLEDTARRSLAASAGRGAARGAVVEMPVEVAQQVIERAQAGLDLTSPDAIKEYGEAAYQAGLIGAPLGGAGNVVSRSQAKEQVAAREEAAKARAEQQTETPAAITEPKAPADYVALAKELATLRTEEQTPEVKARVALIADLLKDQDIAAIEERRNQAEQTAADTSKAKESAFAEPGPAQMEMREALPTGTAKPQTDLFGNPLEAAPDEAAPRVSDLYGGTNMSTQDLRDADLMPAPAELEAMGQQQLNLSGAFTPEDLKAVGIPMGPGVSSWMAKNVVGKTKDEVQSMVDKDPTLVTQKGERAKVLKELLAQQPAKFEEPTNVTPPAPSSTAKPRNEPRASKPSVGVSGEPAASVASEPVPGAPGTTGTSTAPVGRGLVSSGQPAGEGNAPQGMQSTAVTQSTPDDLDTRAQNETRALSTPELRAKIEQAKAQSGPLYTVTHTNKDYITDVSKKVARRYRVARMEGGWTVVSDANGANPTLMPPSRANALSDEDMVRNQHNRFYFAEDAQVTKGSKAASKPAAAKPAAAPIKPAAKPTTAKPAVAAETPQEEAARKAEAEAVRKALEAPPKQPAPKAAAPAPAPVAKTAPVEAENKPFDITAEYDAIGAKNPFEALAAYLKRSEKKEDLESAATTAKGQSLESLKKSIASAKGPLGHALRRLIKSGKIKIEEKHPSGRPVGGVYDGSTVTLYAEGIPEGKLMPVALHEVAAHMGMAKMLGKEMYNDVGQRIMDWVEKKDGSFEATMAQRAYKRIPIRDMKRGPEVFQDELIAYFIEEMAIAEANGELPKVGALRNIWNRIRAAFAKAVGKELKTDINPTEMTAESIYAMAQAAFVEESTTAPTKGEEKMLDSTEPAFQRWFGDSKVVGKDGKPLVMYTGTSKDVDFTSFKIPKNGAWFTTDPAAASQYAVENDSMGFDWANGRPVEKNTAARVMPVYLRIENPYTLTQEERDKLFKADNYKRVQGAIFERAKAQGFDGVDFGDGIWVVIGKPNQIKSAIGNRGTYDETSPNILFSVNASTESLVDSMGPLDAQDKSGLSKLITGVKANPDVDYVTKFRTQTADIAATIEQRLRTKFDGAVRDKLGNLNPMGLYRQAQDYSKMLLEYFQTGTLSKDPVTGLWKSGMGKGVRPPSEVYALIDKYAEKNGYSRERATQIASRVLEGVRLDAMRASNKTGATNFKLHLGDAEIDQLVREYNADPDLKEMSKLMDEARIAMVDNLVKVGRLTKEMGDEWKSVVGYVPFDRIEDFATKYSSAKKISTKGLAQLGKLPELIGSDVRPVGNVFDNYINTLGWMVGQTLKTDATVQTLRSLEDIGQAKYLGRNTQAKPNTVGAYIDGEMMYWELPSKYDLMAFKDLTPPKAGWLRALGEFSNVLRKSVTVLPPFALKQVTDDVQRAILTSGVKNPGALIRMSLTNFGGMAWAELRGIQHPSVKEFGALGLTGEYDFQAGKPANSLLKDLGYKKRSKYETLMHRLDGITRASDLAVRKAIYDQTMIETKDELLAQTRAREFINFRRRGASDFVGAMVTTIPFFNAYIQGMDVLYRAASGKDSSSSIDRAQARRLFWSRASTVMMLSSLYALGKGDDDDDYNEMDLRTRDNNWILPGGYKIPVPGELGALFKVIPERVVEYMRRQGTPEEQTAFEAMRTTLSYMFEQYLGRVVPVPQAIKPVLEAWANKSFLTGRALEGYHHQAMDPSMRVTEQTSELAKAISVFSRDTIGVETSPIMIDNALRGYFGSSAAMLTMVTDSLLNPTRVDRPLHKYALLSNYLYDPVGTRRMTEFYEEREKVGKANTTLNELMKTDLTRAEQYAIDHQDELMLESAVNATLNQLENTRAYRKFLNSAEGAKDMPADEREEALKEIKSMEVEYVKWVREAKAELAKAKL